MKFSEQWLREWVNPDISTTDLAEQLTMAGLEVDAVEPVAPYFSNVVVGEVLRVEPHPGADRLRVCQVNVGAAEALSIVCGAANVAKGVRVPVAVVGAKLPGGINIEKSQLRGETSEGMLCSAKELGLADSSEGLMILSNDAEPGQDVRDYLLLNDVSLELGLTPNRGDCLSVAGIAREVSVINGVPLRDAEVAPVAAEIDEQVPLEVSAPEACPRYTARIVRDVAVDAPTPMWMQERLRRSGLRSINAVVDVTNYVLLELGQPMHAFDLERLKGGIHVRLARANERLRLLDDQEVDLDKDTLVIADHAAAVAMAGIMGGAASAVGNATRHILLESAYFAPAAMAGRARRYGLHTDSSHRFERGVDPESARRAMERATRLLLDIAGGRPGPIMEQSSRSHLPQPAQVPLRIARMGRLLGADIPRAQVMSILKRLGMDVMEENDCWQVTPPSFRFDISIEADLIEELARIYGYSRLPSHSPPVPATMQRRSESKVGTAVLRRRLIERGYQEAITYSFVDPRLQELLDPEHAPVSLANPISADMAVMRTSLWPGLVQALLYNLNRRQDRIRLFEIGTRFRRREGQVREETVIAGIVAGSLMPEQWAETERETDFFDVKKDVETLLAMTGFAQDYLFNAASHPALHPGQTAQFTSPHGREAGILGTLHPRIANSLNISKLTVLFEVALEEIAQAQLPSFREASKYPAIRRDLAVIVDDTVSSAALQGSIREAAGEWLEELQLFDVYKGKGIDSGKKSLALGLTLQDSSRTLTDGDVDIVMERVLARLRDTFGATLRD
ncbi:MAG: phenylalanine--tRNA ligase subunit beta [Gammaproteobacteria bacterium]|jgi:phenylalanyl-tRNA synthetase beta chain